MIPPPYPPSDCCWFQSRAPARISFLGSKAPNQYVFNYVQFTFTCWLPSLPEMSFFPSLLLSLLYLDPGHSLHFPILPVPEAWNLACPHKRHRRTNIVWFYLYVLPTIGKFIETGRRIEITRNQWEGKRDSYCLLGLECFLGIMKKVWIQIVVRVTQHCDCIFF